MDYPRTYQGDNHWYQLSRAKKVDILSAIIENLLGRPIRFATMLGVTLKKVN